MGNPSFAFRFARPCRTDQHSPTCCCILRFKHPLTSHQQRKRAASAAAAAANPTPEPTPAPAADPAPAPTATPAPEVPKPEEAAKPAEDTKPAEDAKPAEAPTKAPFTPAEDVALLSLKAQNKTWKDIHEVLVGRDFDELKNRFKEIGPVHGGQGGEASKDGAAAGASNEAKGNKGKQQQKGDGGKKGKGKQEETKAEEKDEPAVVADAAAPAATPAPVPPPAPINPNEAVVADRKDAQIKGILRRGSDGAFQFGEAVVPDGATTLNGCPIIYLEENDPLDIEEVSHILHFPNKVLTNNLML